MRLKLCEEVAFPLHDVGRSTGEEGITGKLGLAASDLAVKLGDFFLQAGGFGGDVDQAGQREVDFEFGEDLRTGLGGASDIRAGGERVNESLVEVLEVVRSGVESGGDFGGGADQDLDARPRLDAEAAAEIADAGWGAGRPRRGASLTRWLQTSSVRNGTKGWSRRIRWSRTVATTAWAVGRASRSRRRGLIISKYQSQKSPQAKS